MKKRLIALALAMVLCLSVMSGCTFVTLNTEKNMSQIVATADISKEASFASEYGNYSEAISQYAENGGYVIKRDLVAYFMNEGYAYVESYGYTYQDTFDLLMESLVNRKIIVQYALVYFLESDAYSVEGLNAATAALGNDYDSYDYSIAALSYFLDEEDLAVAMYNLKKTINATIDTIEETYFIEADEKEYETSVRTLPDGVDATNEDYYDPAYEIYTGRNAATACGSYETVENSTVNSRKKAYNYFMSNLKSNALLQDGEDSNEFTSLTYWKVEFASVLEESIIGKLAESFEEEAEASLTQEYVEARYNEILQGQKAAYDVSSDSFETALGNASDSSFVMYSPSEGFGFVYNILLPFSAAQSNLLTVYENNAALSKDAYYYNRAKLLQSVRATDQRASWFKGETDYSFKASEANVNAYGGDYLFFENNVVNGGNEESGKQYKQLDKYYGYYAYNGNVEYSEEDGYTVTPNKISIDGFIDEMTGYMAFALGDRYAVTELIDNSASYYSADYYAGSEVAGVLDGSRFIYKAGKFEVEHNANDTFVKDTASYVAMSVINELMFAYNTDTAGLNSYLGYEVSAYDTSFVSEFEYAAKYTVANGVGTYAVVPSTYGWHVIYCSFVYGEGAVYSFDWAEIEEEGTFSYLFYEALKDSDSESFTTVRESQVVTKYDNDDCVTVYENRYEDLCEADKNS